MPQVCENFVPLMPEREEMLGAIRRKLQELNFNINEDVVGSVYGLFAEGCGPDAGEDLLDVFIRELVSGDTLVRLQESAGVNDGNEFDRSWRTSRRSSVYSEKITPETFRLDYHPKDRETVEFLDSILVCDIPFGFLNPQQKMKLIGSMTPGAVASGTRIIEEGDVGSQMYIVESGEFEVVKGGEVVRRLTRGCFFGEIALLHNVPRTATVRASTDSRIWVVEQTAFSGIKMMDRISNKKTVLEGLKEQNVFPSLSDSSYEGMVDALSFVYYKEGSSVEIADSEFFMATADGEVDDGEVRRVRSKEILRSRFRAVSSIQGVHIRNKQRVGCSRFQA